MLQKRIFRIVGPSLAAFLEPMAHRRNVASLRVFYRYYFGRCSSELTQPVPLLYKYVYVNSFFPRTAKLRDFLPIECFPLAYDLNGFKSRINRGTIIRTYYISMN